MAKSVPIGLTNLVYSVLLSDTPPTTAGGTDGVAVYDTPKRILGAITATFSPNASNDTIFADDGPFDTAATLGAMTLELNVADIPAEDRAVLLGATYDEATGTLKHKSTDIPPFVAVGMSVLKSNGARRLLWYLKGKFAAPDDNNQTKADSINWNTPTITGNFLKRDADEQWKIQLDTDDANAPLAMINGWFTTPNIAGGGGASTVVATPVADPVAGALSKATTSSVTVTCATSGATIEYKLSTETAWHTYSTGIATAGWTNGTVILNLRASKLGMTTSSANVTYTVGD